MRVEQLGAGVPEIAVVGAIHGDEPCGVRAIDRLLADPPVVERPVKLIVANEEALDRNVRYIDSDLNRAFGDERDPTAHEYALAKRLADELRGCLTLAIHSTQSHPDPFGLVSGVDELAAGVCPYLSISALVDVEGTGDGRMFAMDTDLIEVEAGYQGSDAAADNAYRLAREFLTISGALPGRPEGRSVPVFSLGTAVEKPPAERYDVFAENFSRVAAGEEFAAADGDPIVAETAFYPVLMSAYGYRDVFGYAGDRIDTLAADGTWPLGASEPAAEGG